MELASSITNAGFAAINGALALAASFQVLFRRDQLTTGGVVLFLGLIGACGVLCAGDVFDALGRAEPPWLNALFWPAMAFIFFFIAVFCMRGGRGFIQESVLEAHRKKLQARRHRQRVKAG